MRKTRLALLVAASVLAACSEARIVAPGNDVNTQVFSAKIPPADVTPPHCASFLYDPSCGSPATDFQVQAAGGALSRQAAEAICKDWDPNCRPRNLSTTERRWIERQLARYDSSSNPNCWQLAGTARFLLTNSNIRAYDNPYTLAVPQQPGDQFIQLSAGDVHGGFPEQSDEPLGMHLGSYRLPRDGESGPVRLTEAEFAAVFRHEITHAAFTGAYHAAGGPQALYESLRRQCG
jgi:hypothetical protein